MAIKPPAFFEQVFGLGLLIFLLGGCQSSGDSVVLSSAEGLVSFPPEAKIVGLTARRSLPMINLNAPVSRSEVMQDKVRPRGAPLVPLLDVINPYELVYVAVQGTDAETRAREEQEINRVMAAEEFEMKLRVACEKRLRELGLKMTHLPRGTRAEPEPRRRHPLAGSEMDFVLGFGFSSIGLGPTDVPSGGATFGVSHQLMSEMNAPLSLVIAVEITTVATADGSTAGGVSFVYRSKTRKKFGQWAKDDARLLQEELKKFWSELDQLLVEAIRRS